MLKVENIRAGYGAINVLWDISISAKKGKLTTIIGPNGAGKTTLLRAIMGLLPLQQGSIYFKEQSFDTVQSYRKPWQGVVMIPEGRMIFRDMTVEENLMLGAFVRKSRKAAKSKVKHAYERFPQLYERRTRLAGTLSGGEAQMLAMSRGLMSDPQVLIIDEPSLGLAPVIVNEIFALLTTLKSEGRTIVLVEQNTHKALEVADYVYLMQSGKVVLSREATAVSLDELHALYFALESVPS